MNYTKGFIRLVIIIIIALIVLGYYGIDVKKAIQAPTTKSNLSYAEQIVSNVWHNYLEKPAKYLWKVFIDIVWKPAVRNLIKIGNNESTDIDKLAPKLSHPITIP